MLLRLPWRTLASFAALAFAVASSAQTVMGTISTHDAHVNGAMQVRGERAELLSNDAITAFDHTAPIALTRGGEVLVCSTSQFHLLRSGTDNALLFGLDRGALELHGTADQHDILITPDIRFSLESPGTYNLSVRVTSNGDTCVQNTGTGAPTIILSDPFSSSTYRVIPGQHVLFEHGNLHEVVDNERSSCGCPAETPTASQTPAEQAHPFPAAASAGLVPITPVGNSTPDGQVHTQIDANLSYSAGQPKPATDAPASTANANPAAASASTMPPPAPPGAHDIGHAIGHFFHKLFHPNEKPAQ
jgi:hypothetical protein